jgi:hypothetical protein
MTKPLPFIITALLLFIFACSMTANTDPKNNFFEISGESLTILNTASFDTSFKIIHVLVALCDNKYQGIVPVPQKIGNGQDPNNNLYWGCSGGIRTYFKNSRNWTLIKQYKIDKIRLERVIFKHKKGKYYMIADAYDGKFIKDCTIDFFKSCSGQYKDTLSLNGTILGINGNSKLVAYIGHDGLMDFALNEKFENTDNKTRDAIMLSCISKKYFSNHLLSTKANPLLWSTGLMSPEAYSLHDALDSYINNESAESIRNSAANAYSKYQKCSVRASKNLLVSGL